MNLVCECPVALLSSVEKRDYKDSRFFMRAADMTRTSAFLRHFSRDRTKPLFSEIVQCIFDVSPSAKSQVAHEAGAHPSFCSMKRLGVFLLPPGWDASPSQGYPPALNLPVPIYTPEWREAL